MPTTIYKNYFIKACVHINCKLEMECSLRFNVVHTGFKGTLNETILVQENVLTCTGDNTLNREFYAL